MENQKEHEKNISPRMWRRHHSASSEWHTRFHSCNFTSSTLVILECLRPGTSHAFRVYICAHVFRGAYSLSLCVFWCVAVSEERILSLRSEILSNGLGLAFQSAYSICVILTSYRTVFGSRVKRHLLLLLQKKNVVRFLLAVRSRSNANDVIPSQLVPFFVYSDLQV